MRTIGLFALLCLGSPLWAQENSSLRIDLSLYQSASCRADLSLPPFTATQPQKPFTVFAHRDLCQPYDHLFPARQLQNDWETRATTWLTISRTKHLGISLDFATGEKNQTLKLRGRRIMFERRF